MAFRGGPSLEGGFSYDVTAGVQVIIDRDSLNPLAGRLGMTAGAGVVVNGAGAVPSADEVGRAPRNAADNAIDGIGFVEATLNVIGQRWTPGTGWVARAVGSVGAGSGTMSTWNGSVLQSADAALFTTSLGAELGWHWGGGAMDSFGVFVGGGVTRANVSSAVGQTSWTTPYVSVRLEGGVMFQAFIALLEISGGR